VLGAGHQPRGRHAARVLGLSEQPRVRGLRTLNWEQPAAALWKILRSDGQVRALICNGGNPGRVPDQAKVVRALESLDLLVCLDVHMSATPQLADYVFSCKLSLEKPDYTRHPSGISRRRSHSTHRRSSKPRAT
jgi:anaerobic selenocysteine-containing dehydrogenase